MRNRVTQQMVQFCNVAAAHEGKTQEKKDKKFAFKSQE